MLLALTGSLHSAEDGVLRRDDSDVVILEVSCDDPLADLELVNIDGEEIRKVRHESAYAYIA